MTEASRNLFTLGDWRAAYRAGATPRGLLTELQTVSTLPEGVALKPEYSTAEIQVHPSG